MSAADENRKVIEGFWDDLYRPDLEAAAGRFAPDGTYTDVGTPEDDVARGPDEIVRRLTLAWAKLTSLRDERRCLVAGDDAVMTEHVEHWEWPTGEKMALPVVSVHVLVDGRIVRWTDYWDMAALVAAAPQWWFEHVMQGWK
ncbi:MAG TPA: nuclear transport factor 2 family protein [Acidimicrobiales bacterium]|nr:nuclear transport factor 2 family protein [Acidimicrobiales bacterium]